jgi:hypothetical protein
MVNHKEKLVAGRMSLSEPQSGESKAPNDSSLMASHKTLVGFFVGDT